MPYSKVQDFCAFDYNQDGVEELIFWEDRGLYVYSIFPTLTIQQDIYFSEKIEGVDLVYSLVTGNSQGLAWTKKRVYLFSPKNSYPSFLPKAKKIAESFSFLGRYPAFCFLNEDSFPDLALPFRDKTSWFYAIYLGKKESDSFIYLGKIYGGNVLSPFPPSLFAVDVLGTKSPELLVHGPGHIYIYEKKEKEYSLYKDFSIPLKSSTFPVSYLKDKARNFLILSWEKGISHLKLLREELLSFSSFPLDLPLVTFTSDLNQDGQGDISVLGVSLPSSWQVLYSYLVRGKIPFFIQGVDFLSSKDSLAPFSSRSFSEELLFAPKKEGSTQKILLWEDLDTDTWKDVCWKNEQGEVFLSYGISRLWQKYPKKHREAFSQIQKQIYLTGEVALDQEEAMPLPQLKGKKIEKAITLKQRGKHSHLAFLVINEKGDREVLLLKPEDFVFVGE